MKVWFTGAGETSDSFTFHVDKATAERRARDRWPIPTTRARRTSRPTRVGDGTRTFLSAYTDAVTAIGIGASTSTTWTRWGAAPDHLGVLGHYDAVVLVHGPTTCSRGWPASRAARARRRWPTTMMLQVRAFLNEGGRLLNTGRHAGWQFANAFDYNPVSTPPLCDAVDLHGRTTAACSCRTTSCSTGWGRTCSSRTAEPTWATPPPPTTTPPSPWPAVDIPFAGAVVDVHGGRSISNSPRGPRRETT